MIVHVVSRERAQPFSMIFLHTRMCKEKLRDHESNTSIAQLKKFAAVIFKVSLHLNKEQQLPILLYARLSCSAELFLTIFFVESVRASQTLFREAHPLL